MRGGRPKPTLSENATLGERLRFKRLELGHRITDAATVVGVDPKTWMWWERDEKLPFVNQYPGIIRYLGYEPWSDPTSLGEQLLAVRRRLGLSIKRASEMAGVDEGTFARWESEEWKPQSRSLRTISDFLK